MITNYNTNKVYLAKGMSSEKYVAATGSLLGTLHNQKVHWGFLPLTASPLHIWARDYMPIQVSKNKFVRFNYSPDYLKDYPNYKSFRYQINIYYSFFSLGYKKYRKNPHRRTLLVVQWLRLYSVLPMKGARA